MVKEFLSHEETAEIHEADSDVLLNMKHIRVYCTQKTGGSFNLQIRSRNPLRPLWRTGGRITKERNLIATVSVDIPTIEKILTYMKKEMSE